MMSQLKELQDQNRRLKKMYAEAQPSRPLEGGVGKKGVRPSRRREMGQAAVEGGRTGIRHACMHDVGPERDGVWVSTEACG